MFDRRKFLKQTARTTGALWAGSTTTSFWSRNPLCAADVAKASPLKVCLVSGSGEYKSNESLAAWQTELESRYPVLCTRVFWTEGKNNDLPGLEALDTTDVMVLFTKRLKIDGEQLERVKKYCLSGRPIVGIRTASHAFQNWLALDKEVFGGDYHSHYGGGTKIAVEIVPAQAQHPILKGVKPFTSTCKVYKNPRVAEDVTVLLTGTMPDQVQPLAWTREFKSGRVFYTSLGDPDDFQIEDYRRLLVNSLQWTTGRSFDAGR